MNLLVIYRRVSKLTGPKFEFLLFIFSMATIKVYPMALFLNQNPLFSTHNLAKILLLAVFFTCFLRNKRLLIQSLKKNSMSYILAFYILAQSISIFRSTDIFLFLKSFSSILCFAAIYVLSNYLFSYTKLRWIITSSIIILGMFFALGEFFFQVYFYWLLPIIEPLLERRIFEALLYNMAQGKITLAIGSEIFLPFLITSFLVLTRKKIIKMLIAICVLLLIYTSVFSNFRIRFLEVFFALIGMATLKKTSKLLIVGVFLVSLTAVVASNFFFSFNVIDRFLLKSDLFDKSSVDGRIYRIQQAVTIFQQSPIVGVGLGNYPLYINTGFVKELGLPSGIEELASASLAMPHNIFLQQLAETGILGLLMLFVLLFHFAKQDYFVIKKSSETFASAFIVASWMMILWAFFNPADTLFTFGWFWLFRGILASMFSDTQKA